MAWFEYPTNFSNGTEVNGTYDLFLKYPTYIIGSNYSAGFILLLWVFIFGIILVSGAKKSMAVASFITFIISVFFAMKGLLNPVIPVGLIILAIIGALGSKSGDY